MALERVELRGDAYHGAALDLMLAARGDDDMAGLYEAGDLQWWRPHEAELKPVRTSFWRAPAGAWAACLLVADDGARLDADLLWRPRFEAAVRDELVGAALAELATLARGAGRPLDLLVRDDDLDMGRRLGRAGFVRWPANDIVQLAQRPLRAPPRAPLPTGLRLADAAGRQGPFPRAARRSRGFAAALRACPLYRGDLDLAVVTDDGEIAAHALCWFDEVNAVGLFEPVRTEDAFQRRGLGRALMTEGIDRLMAAGARLIKVSHHAPNRAARRLYRASGFAPAFVKLGYRCRADTAVGVGRR